MASILDTIDRCRRLACLDLSTDEIMIEADVSRNTAISARVWAARMSKAEKYEYTRHPVRQYTRHPVTGLPGTAATPDSGAGVAANTNNPMNQRNT